MTKSDATGAPPEGNDMTRVVTCELEFVVEESTEVVLQIVAARSAGRVVDERFEVTLDGGPPRSLVELASPVGERMHVIKADPGRLSIAYRSELRATPPDNGETGPADLYESQVYLRPSRYVPSDHLIGFSVAEFGIGPDVGARVQAITEWIWKRISYVPGSSDVHDSAEDTLLTGEGTCRDFAHLGVALCRATGIPARFAAVYAPGLSPMDFHAVFEALIDGRWQVHDASGLAPRASLVRIVTGRDAADAAFSAVNGGVASPAWVSVSATVGSTLPADDAAKVIALA
jgi:transglutaminase-like putative cysteine protease